MNIVYAYAQRAWPFWEAEVNQHWRMANYILDRWRTEFNFSTCSQKKGIECSQNKNQNRVLICFYHSIRLKKKINSHMYQWGWTDHHSLQEAFFDHLRPGEKSSLPPKHSIIRLSTQQQDCPIIWLWPTPPPDCGFLVHHSIPSLVQSRHLIKMSWRNKEWMPLSDTSLPEEKFIVSLLLKKHHNSLALEDLPSSLNFY